MATNPIPTNAPNQFMTPASPGGQSIDSNVAQSQPFQAPAMPKMQSLAPKPVQPVQAPIQQTQAPNPAPIQPTPQKTQQPSGSPMNSLLGIPTAQAQEAPIAPSAPQNNSPVIPKDRISQMLNTTSADSVMHTVYNSDPAFKAKVDMMQPFYQQQSPDWQARFPTFALNKYYGIDPTMPSDPTTAKMLSTMTDPQAQQTPWFAKVGDYLGKTLSNVPGDAMQVAQGVGQSIMHPIQTAEGLGKAAIGIGQQVDKLLPQGMQAPASNSPFLQETDQIGKGIVQNATNAVEHPLQTLQDHPVQTLMTLSPAAGAVLGKLGDLGDAASELPGVGKVITATKDAVQSKANSAAQSIMAKTLKLKPTDRARIELPNVAGTTAEKWLLDRGIAGSIPKMQQQLDELSTASKAKVDQGLAKIPTTYDIGPAPGQENLMNQMKGMTDAQSTGKLGEMVSSKAADEIAHPVQQALSVLKNTFGDKPGNEDLVSHINNLQQKQHLTLSDINDVKRMIDNEMNLYKSTGEISTSATARGLGNIRSSMQKMIEDEASKHGFKDVKNLNKTTQVAHEINDAIGSRATTAANNAKASLKMLGSAGIGSIVGGVPGAIGGAALEEVLSHPTFRLNFTKIISTMGTDEKSVLARSLAGKGSDAGNTLLRSILSKAAQKTKQAMPSVGSSEILSQPQQ